MPDELLAPLEAPLSWPGAPVALFVFVIMLPLGLFNDVLFVSRVVLRLAGYEVSRLEPNPVSRVLSLELPPWFLSQPTKASAAAEQIVISVFFIMLLGC